VADITATVCSPATVQAKSNYGPRDNISPSNFLVASTGLKKRPLPRYDTLSAWNKARWEAEWESELSSDVAKRLRDIPNTAAVTDPYDYGGRPSYPLHAIGKEDDSGEAGRNADYDYDPLHLPSLLMLSFSLLGPLQRKLGRTFLNLFGGNTCASYGASLPPPVRTSNRVGSRGRARAGLFRGVPGRETHDRATTAFSIALLGGFCVGLGVGMFLK